MIKDKTIEMAREAGAADITSNGWTSWVGTQSTEFLKRFEALIRADAHEATNRRANASWTLMCEKMVAAEREACAALAEKLEWADNKGVASAIRARGETK